MNAKLNFLKSAIARLEDDREFMACTLKKYREFEKISEQELCTVLGCSMDDYYKLALCKTPDMKAADFPESLTTISEYTNSIPGQLKAVIKRVNILLKFTEPGGVTLMAARDKEDGKNDKK